MKAPQAPHLDERRAEAFVAELRERAQAWVPTWGLANSEQDFGRALLEIAARFSSEVAERLDGAGCKMRRGFLDWLGVPRTAARPSRLPVVFKLTDAAQEAVLAAAPVQLQADAAGTSIVFETEKAVRVVPGRLGIVVGADADADAFYLPPPGLSELKPLESLPTRWRVKSFAPAGASKVQLDPELGLLPGTIVGASGQQYTFDTVDKDLVTIRPPLANELTESALVSKVTTFSPFGGEAHNWQEHALYLGDLDLLNIEAAATIEVVGASALTTGITWQYWGKVAGNDELGWQPLTLAVKQKSDAVVLTKDKGAIEPVEINGKNSRWIRATTKRIESPDQVFSVDALKLRINCTSVAPCPPPDSVTPGPNAEAMVNNTPLVVSEPFYPLGREPHQFDAFYLGCSEAFSKKGAAAQVCFEMADPTFASLSAIRTGAFANVVLAGVGEDRALQLRHFDPTSGRIDKFRQREPLQPPFPGLDGNGQSTYRVALDAKPFWRLPIWNEGGLDFLVGTTAGSNVWVWHEKFLDQSNSGWISFGQIPASVPPATRPVDGLVYLADLVTPQIAVLREGKLFTRKLPNGLQFDPINTTVGVNPVVLKSIVPVLEETSSGQLVTSTALGMIGVAEDGALYEVALNGQCAALPPVKVDMEVRPVAVKRHSGPRVIVLTQQSRVNIVSSHSVYGMETLNLEVGARVLGFDAVISGGNLNFLASVQLDGTGYLASWVPQTAPGTAIQVFRAPIPLGVGGLGGIPTEIAQHVVVPGSRADVLVAEFDLTQRLQLQADVKAGIVAPASTPAFQPNDVVTVDIAPHGPFTRRVITESEWPKDGEVLYPIDQPFNPGATGSLYGFHSTGPFLTGDLDHTNASLKLDPADQATVEGALLLSKNVIHRVGQINVGAAGARVATLDPAPANDVVGASYWNAVPINGRIAPFMRLDAANNNWNAALLDRASLVFSGASALNQEKRAKAFSAASGNRPILVVLTTDWTAAPVPGVAAHFVLDAVVGSWSRMLGDTSTNPELSWEYWNGKGWWSLVVTLDETLYLKTTGAVRFQVPDDIASSDWAGKTNFWIRSRLVGGDYGREEVKVISRPGKNPGETEQIVERSTDNIKAPQVLGLQISYSICDELLPTLVLAQDSGSIRDQSAANRTAGAIVEAFVPLAVTLGRLAKTAVSTIAPDGCPPECNGANQHAGTTTTPPTNTQTATAPAATGRALFIGLTATPSEAPVNVLLLVEEHDHTAFAPMTIEALVADRFVPIVADDTTRALGESGLLSMAFAIPPTPRDLFGQIGLTWLRLLPKASTNSAWLPVLRGAYLNAVWASATETLTRELLGSSDGMPNMSVRLARPPLLYHTLELRVKEPLGEEERAALLQTDAASVLSTVDGLPGDWVLWKQVVDPNDEPANERVYALDESTGEIRFGDGLHGLIPPIGRDSIVAFSYKRTEPGPSGNATFPGNLITARTALNLVSPVESVESVIAADQSAGGAPPEDDDRVLRFGYARLRHRNRAVTLQDLEDLTLESSPDFAQALAMARQSHVQLTVVMRGKNPTPSAAQTRELRRYLLAAAPASLGAPNALRIAGPSIRKLRLDLTLRVTALDKAGALTEVVKQKLISLFDTSTGGVDGDSWPLGANPSEDDIAFALVDAPYLDSIKNITLREIASDGSEQLWPVTLKPTELAMLAADPIRIQFETAEAAS